MCWPRDTNRSHLPIIMRPPRDTDARPPLKAKAVSKHMHPFCSIGLCPSARVRSDMLPPPVGSNLGSSSYHISSLCTMRMRTNRQTNYQGCGYKRMWNEIFMHTQVPNKYLKNLRGDAMQFKCHSIPTCVIVWSTCLHEKASRKRAKHRIIHLTNKPTALHQDPVSRCGWN